MLRTSLASVSMALLVLSCGPTPRSEWRSAYDATEVGWMMYAWGSGPSDLWNVGGSPAHGVVMHFDGATWSERPTGIDVPLLDWTFGFGPDDVWVVGQSGTILHWDGTSFTPEDSTTTEHIWGIWGTAPSDLWAVGGSGFPDASPTILHRDAAGWSVQALPTLMRTNVHGLFKVWGVGRDDVWVVGQHGAVLHFDGTVWTERLAGTGEDLISVWGTSTDHVVLVGGRGNAVAILWDGSVFTPIPTDLLPGLNGVWMDQPDVIHVVGGMGTRLAIDPEGHVLRDDTLFVNEDFHSVFGAPGGLLLAVGGNLLSPSGPYRGLSTIRERGIDE